MGYALQPAEPAPQAPPQVDDDVIFDVFDTDNEQAQADEENRVDFFVDPPQQQPASSSSMVKQHDYEFSDEEGEDEGPQAPPPPPVFIDLTADTDDEDQVAPAPAQARAPKLIDLTKPSSSYHKIEHAMAVDFAPDFELTITYQKETCDLQWTVKPALVFQDRKLMVYLRHVKRGCRKTLKSMGSYCWSYNKTLKLFERQNGRTRAVTNHQKVHLKAIDDKIKKHFMRFKRECMKSIFKGAVLSRTSSEIMRACLALYLYTWPMMDEEQRAKTEVVFGNRRN